MKNSDQEIKKLVKDKYGQIAQNALKNSGCGCGCGCDPNGSEDLTLFQDDYSQLDGYVSEADLGLGCGIPTEYADIKSGDTVVDLGSGAGNDVFVVRSIVGKTGKVIGIDMTEEMILKAQENNLKMGYSNVSFRLGDIEKLPIDDNSTDVVVSNCVLNLVPDKQKAFNEIFRVLRPGAHFCVSDIVSSGNLPESLKKSSELYVGCVAGAPDIEEYLHIIKNAGFDNIEVNSKKKIILTNELMQRYLSDEEMAEVSGKDIGIYSITVSGYKA